MPCSYDESAEEIQATEKARKERLVSPYKKKLDTVTRLLCTVMTLDDNTELSPLQFCEAITNYKELQSWWKEHKQRDLERSKSEAREVVKKKALEKLTTEEKKLLGLTK